MIKRIREQYPQYDDLPDDDLLEMIHQKHYPDMPKDEFNRRCGCPTPPPDHENLEECAVRGEDSLKLQDMDPTIKPAVKMTFKEFTGPQPGKVAVVLEDGTTYVIVPYAVTPRAALSAIFAGNDSELLGYPQKGPEHAAVTKQGDVVTDLDEMKEHADAGNVAWAANGEENELMDKSHAVSNRILVETDRQ